MKPPQKGMALIEALVTSAVLGIGLLGATQLTLKAMQTSIETRQRGVAQLLAQEGMDCATSGSACASEYSTEVQGVRYTRQIKLTPRNAGLQDIQVTVQWASPLSTASGVESGRLVWHGSVSSLPGWVGQ